MARRRIVVKLGGALARDAARLRPLLAGLAAAEDNVVIVPGGGGFADAVRATQAALGFDDALAHRLALDAMASMAQVLAALEPRLAPADSLPAIGAIWRDGLVPVWSPAMLRAGHPDIAESWTVTSDSLAVWLATAIEADGCVLVKCTDHQLGSGPHDWAASGLVDPALPAFAKAFRGALLIHGPASGDIAASLAMAAAAAPAPAGP